MIYITSDAGRIGEVWWFNSDPRPVYFGMVVKRRLVRWGTFGIGRDVRIALEPIDE